MIFICPKCKEKLQINESGALVCKNRHSFDRSREGYYNLLLSNTSHHGDNSEMVLARRTFLASGAYERLAEKLFEISKPYLIENANLLDAGCGEGYYTDYLQKKLSSLGVPFSFFGFDISKDAVRLAAKKNRELRLAVGSSYRMPIESQSTDVFYNIFSPLAIEETARVIKKGGKFIMAIPAEEHLYELKSILYDTPYKNTPETASLPGFSLLCTHRLNYEIELTEKSDIYSLFMMTPYAYRTPRAARERISALDRLKTRVQFIVFAYNRD